MEALQQLHLGIKSNNADLIRNIKWGRPPLKSEDKFVREIIKVNDLDVLQALDISASEANTILQDMFRDRYENGIVRSWDGIELETIKYYFARGASVSGIDATYHPTGVLPYVRKPEITRYFIENGADPNKIVDFLNLSGSVANQIKFEIVRAMLDGGADVNQTDNWKFSPIQLCLDNPALIDLLISRGANVKYQRDGQTAVQIAIYQLLHHMTDRPEDKKTKNKLLVIKQLLSAHNAFTFESYITSNQDLKNMVNYLTDDNKKRIKVILGVDLDNLSKWSLLKTQLPQLSDTVEWFDGSMDAEQVASKPGKWFYNTRDADGKGRITRIFDHILLERIKNEENPFTRQKWSSEDLRRFTIGEGGSEKKYHLHESKKYLIKTGPRGGKYIEVRGYKIRV